MRNLTGSDQPSLDILQTLKAEHDALRVLFDELKETTDRGVKKREGLLEEIEANLIPHAKWEEKVFYPAFKERADRDGLQPMRRRWPSTMPSKRR